MLYFSKLKKEELSKYAQLTRKELSAEEYFSPEVLLEEWDEIDSFVLKNKDGEWVGWCAISSKGNICNPDGKDFLCGVIFPEYRGKGYSKYLYKIYFDKSLGLPKLISVSPYQDKLVNLSQRCGFKPHSTNKIWNTYECDKDYYPDELNGLKLVELS